MNLTRWLNRLTEIKLLGRVFRPDPKPTRAERKKCALSFCDVKVGEGEDYCKLHKSHVGAKIAHRSKKRSKQEGRYSYLRKEYLRQNDRCECCNLMATEIHHKKGRVGKLLTDVEFFMSVCRACHETIELHPDWAKEKGYSISRLSN